MTCNHGANCTLLNNEKNVGGKHISFWYIFNYTTLTNDIFSLVVGGIFMFREISRVTMILPWSWRVRVTDIPGQDMRLDCFEEKPFLSVGMRAFFIFLPIENVVSEYSSGFSAELIGKANIANQP